MHVGFTLQRSIERGRDDGFLGRIEQRQPQGQQRQPHGQQMQPHGQQWQP